MVAQAASAELPVGSEADAAESDRPNAFLDGKAF